MGSGLTFIFTKLFRPLRFVFKRLRPKKMRTYLMLLTLLSIVLTQGTVYFAFQYYRNKVLNPSSAELVSDTIRIMHGTLDRMEENQQKDYVEQATHGKWTIVTRERPYISREARAHQRAERKNRLSWWERWIQEPFKNDQSWQMTRNLNRLLGDQTRVRPAFDREEALLISLEERLKELPEGTFTYERWLKIPLASFQRGNSSLFMVLWWSAVLVSIGLSALFAWYVVRPLQNLSDAANQLAAGNPQNVTLQGPYEIRSLAKRFNAMIQALDEAERTQKTLLAGLPHDLKGPLSRMRLRAELIEDESVRQGLKTDVQDIQKIIEQFIAFLRGKDVQTYTFTEVPVQDWFHEKMFSWQESFSTIQTKVELVHPQLTWSIDTLAMSRLIDNLIHNAMQHGVPPIEVTLKEQRKTIVLTVTDQGSGIPEAELQKAFRPFERLDSARTTTGSSGLGLAVVQGIAQAHLAEIRCQHQPPHGWSISVIFPKKDQETV